jgi:lysozyme
MLKSIATWLGKLAWIPTLSPSSEIAFPPIPTPPPTPPQPSAAPSPSTPHGAVIDRDAMICQLRLHEGERLKPYRCTAGKLTIGVGRNLEDRGITATESAYLLGNDIDGFYVALQKALPWVSQLDEVRQRVLLDMAFNLGIQGLLTFKNTLATIKAGDYGKAGPMMLQSKWAEQVGRRAERLSTMMVTGKDPRELWPPR